MVKGIKFAFSALASVIDFVISVVVLSLFMGWLTGFVKVYSIFGKYFIVVG